MFIIVEHDNQYTKKDQWVIALSDDGILLYGNTKLETYNPIYAYAYTKLLEDQGHKIAGMSNNGLPTWWDTADDLKAEAWKQLKHLAKEGD